MSDRALTGRLTEDELDVLVSVALRRAEILDEIDSPGAGEAWREVMEYETRLAALTSPAEITGGIARVGAVAAALAAGERLLAQQLSAQYLAEALLPVERRAAIARVFQEDEERLASRLSALSRSGRLSELAKWRVALAQQTGGVFPRAA